jgi:hypothetical protein
MPTYRADLSEGFDHYLSQLSRNTRYQARKIIKQLNDNSMKLASPATHEERLVWFNRLIVLHQHRWTERGLAGAFSDERITRFHTLIFSLAHQVCIYRLAHSGIDIGYIYGFLTADRFDWYQMGIEFAGSNLQRPGYALHLATIRTLSTTTATRYYEFLAGANQLKTQLGPLREEAMNVELYKCTLPHRLKTTISAILLRSRKLLSR